MAALPGWMAACAAVGAVGAVGLRALSPSKRQRGDDDDDLAIPVGVAKPIVGHGHLACITCSLVLAWGFAGSLQRPL